MAVDSRVLCPEPELCRPVLRANINETGVEYDTKRMFRVLAAQIGVDELTFVCGKEGVGSDEMGFRSGAEDVGEDANRVLVGIDFGKQPLFADRGSVLLGDSAMSS